jgi:hypothetical protein
MTLPRRYMTTVHTQIHQHTLRPLRLKVPLLLHHQQPGVTVTGMSAKGMAIVVAAVRITIGLYLAYLHSVVSSTRSCIFWRFSLIYSFPRFPGISGPKFALDACPNMEPHHYYLKITLKSFSDFVEMPRLHSMDLIRGPQMVFIPG